MAVHVQQVFFGGADRAAEGGAVPGAGPRSLAGWIRIIQHREQLQHTA